MRVLDVGSSDNVMLVVLVVIATSRNECNKEMPNRRLMIAQASVSFQRLTRTWRDSQGERKYKHRLERCMVE